MSLLQMSVTGGVMILAITVLRALAMNHVPKKTFLALWGAALLRLVLPVSLSSTLSIYSLLGQKTALNVVDVPAAATPALLPGQAVAALPQIDAAPVQTISVWSIVWIAGVVLCAAFFAAVYWKCCREFRMSFPVDNDASRQWLQTHPLRRGICIRQSDQISSPLTFGVLHPVILMPKKTDWNDETALQYVLEHEFVHIRRFDAVSKLLLIAAACVHWFNPLVWVMSLLLAALLVAGTVTVFATSAKTEEPSVPVKGTGAVVEQNSAAGSGGSVAVETGEPLEPSAEYAAAGIRRQETMWYYQKQSIAMIYDDNGSIYMDEEAADGIYLHIIRGSRSSISEVTIVTKQQCRELADRHMNAIEPESAENTLMSYVDPSDGKTYYSFDGSKTFEPMTDAEFEARFPTPDVEWWTYDEYKAWLDNEKVQLQSLLGEEAWTSSDGSFIWTQEKIDETIALYEGILEDMKNGVMYSKNVDGQDDVLLSYNPADISTSAD